MKKLIVIAVAVVLVIVIATVIMHSLNENGKVNIVEPQYKATSQFLYSSDKGHLYGAGTKEYPVGETVYMKVKFKVESNKKNVVPVHVILSIPNIDNVAAKYLDGQVITPKYDEASKVTTYDFIASASENAAEQECVLQFVPNAVGTVRMTLVFDDNVDPTFDSQSTLVFVDAKPSETEPVATPTPEPTPTPVPTLTPTPEPTPTPVPTPEATENETSAEDTTESSETKQETKVA